MAKSLLDRARRYFRHRKYNEVITLLEPEIIQYRDSFQFYYLLGLACLYTGDIGGATSYFQRARQIKMRDPDLLVAQAALYLRRGDTHQAVEYYLEALEYAPEHRLSRKSLNFIRKNGDENTIASLVETGAIEKFYPSLPGVHHTGRIAVIAGVIIAVCCIGVFTMYRYKIALNNSSRADMSSFQLDSEAKKDVLETGGSYRFVLTEKQLLDSYNDALHYFQNYRDNAVQVEINRILNSNASVRIRTNARYLMTYLKEPGFDSLKDNYTYSQVMQEPWLYQDCWIIWKGMATNIHTTDSFVDFDFLIGYDTRKKLEGVVPVHFDTVLSVDPERPLEILAKISVESEKISLVGSSIFQSGKPAVR